MGYFNFRSKIQLDLPVVEEHLPGLGQVGSGRAGRQPLYQLRLALGVVLVVGGGAPDVDGAGLALLGELVPRLGAHGEVPDAHPAVDADHGLVGGAGVDDLDSEWTSH